LVLSRTGETPAIFLPIRRRKTLIEQDIDENFNSCGDKGLRTAGGVMVVEENKKAVASIFLWDRGKTRKPCAVENEGIMGKDSEYMGG